MKIRNGFISNSSTSSFIVIGSFIDHITEKDKETLNSQNIDCFYVEDKKGDYILGYILGEISECGVIREGEFTVEQLEKITNETRAIIKEQLNIDIEPKLLLVNTLK